MATVQQDEKQIVAQNKKARHDYFVLETYEAGIELFGTEVKSIRKGRVNLKNQILGNAALSDVDNGVNIHSI